MRTLEKRRGFKIACPEEKSRGAWASSTTAASKAPQSVSARANYGQQYLMQLLKRERGSAPFALNSGAGG